MKAFYSKFSINSLNENENSRKDINNLYREKLVYTELLKIEETKSKSLATYSVGEAVEKQIGKKAL